MRRRNTSSSDDRRTSTVSGSSPRWCAAAADGLAVVGVDEDAVRQVLDPLAQPVELAVERLLDADREPELGHLARRVLVDQLARRALGDDLRLVHDDEPVAQLLGLVHVVGRQDERHAPLLEPVQPLPEQVARLRVEAGRGLVEEQDRGLVDQRAGDRQPPLHAARQRLDLVVRPLGQLGELEQLVAAARGLRPRHAEVAAVDHEVVVDRELRVQRVLLGHDAQPAADPRAVGVRVEVEDPERARGHRRDAARPCAWSRSCRRRSGRGSRSSRRARRRSRWRRPR